MKTIKDDHTRWQGLQVDYDALLVSPNSVKECLYCLTDAQVKLLLAISEPYKYVTRWFYETEPVARTVLSFVNDTQRRLLMSCCDDDLIYTYDEDGNLEVSEDGGETYTPAPQSDIRLYPPVVFPEPAAGSGVDELCLAADGMVNLIREQIGDQLTEDMTRYTLGQLLSDWTKTMIGTSNPFQALVVIITNQIFALLISAIISALTDDVYQLLRCIFSSYMSAAVSFDTAAAEGVRSGILSQITGIAGVFLERLVYLLGSGGLTNLARSMAGVDDSVCCPVCSADGWVIGEWQGATFYDYTSTQETARTSTSITGMSYDRGDGKQVIIITTIDRVTPSHWIMEFIGTASSSQTNAFNDAPVQAESTTMITDLTGTIDGHNATQILIGFDSAPINYQVKFTCVNP